MHRRENIKNVLVLTPLYGAIIFVALYAVATLLYPGGSQVSKTSVGFSWANNYWCNLLNDKAINGQPNPAKPVAITGMFVLCSTLSLFWFVFTEHSNLGKNLTRAIHISGTLAAIIGFFLFTSINHDFVINLASVFGIIPFVGVFIGLYQKQWFGLFTFGLVNILLVGVNNYVYYTKGLIIYLPIIQKISFGAVLLWICWIDIELYRAGKKHTFLHHPKTP